MQSSRQYALIFSLVYFIPVFSDKPQITDNLWHLTAEIGTEVDNLALCASTPIVIPSTGTTMGTAGVYCLANNVTLDSTSNIAIDQSNVIFDLNNHTISAAPLNLTDDIIKIGATQFCEQVTIKNGSIVSNFSGNGIALMKNSSNITLQDLTINSINIGVTTSDNSVNIIGQNINVYGVGESGFKLNNVNYVLLENCSVSNGPGARGYYLTGSSSCITFKNCSAQTLGVEGFRCDAGVHTENTYIFENCQSCNTGLEGFAIDANYGNQNVIFNSCISTQNNNGFSLTGSQSFFTNAFTFTNCKAHSNHASGFYLALSGGVCNGCLAEKNIDGFQIQAFEWELNNCGANNNRQFGFHHCNQAQGIFFKNCVASFNDQAGFDGLGNGMLISQCTANNNTRNGFDFSSTGTSIIEDCVISFTGQPGFASNGILFSQCTANSNIGNGFDFSNTSTFTIESCVAHSNGEAGFNERASNPGGIFYLNSAARNTPNYNNVSNVVTLGTTNAGYGSNLSA